MEGDTARESARTHTYTHARVRPPARVMINDQSTSCPKGVRQSGILLPLLLFLPSCPAVLLLLLLLLCEEGIWARYQCQYPLHDDILTWVRPGPYQRHQKPHPPSMAAGRIDHWTDSTPRPRSLVVLGGSGREQGTSGTLLSPSPLHLTHFVPVALLPQRTPPSSVLRAEVDS